MLKITMILLGIVVLTLLTAGNSFACDCNTLSATESFKVADSVFSGRVVRVDDSGSSRLYTFVVERSLKGNNPDEVVITGGKSNCAFEFNLDGSYIVYARKFEGQLFASICSSTAALADSGERQQVAAIKPTPLLTSKPKKSYGEIVLITGLSVLLSLLIGFLVMRFWKRAA